MKWRALLAGALVAALALALSLTAGGATKRTSDDSLVGAGSSFAAPLFTAWYQSFNPKAGANVSYNSIGSGAGIAQITARTVDFGASDAPLTPSQASACNGCVQIPVLLGTTAILYNVPGATKQINLTGPIIANIYLGNITQWDDAAIKAINPGANLPSLKITPAYRSDGSGTSYNITDYLSKVSPAFAGKVGKSTQPPFPVGVGGRGSSGVAGVVTSTPGAIGYADVAYALKNQLHFARVKNKAGVYATPGIRAGRRGGRDDQERPARQRDLDRRSAGQRQDTDRLPDQHLHLGDRSARVEEGEAAQAVPPLRDQHPGPGARHAAPVRADAEGPGGLGQDDLQDQAEELGKPDRERPSRPGRPASGPQASSSRSGR